MVIANDALTVVVNADNDWATCLTVEQLNTIWDPKSEDKVTNWNQVDPSFPDEKLVLFGAGTDSGTFDYFTDAINGEEGASRTDYSPTENDNNTVQGVQGSAGGLGYFGYSYFEQNADNLTAVEIDGGDGCVSPSAETVSATAPTHRSPVSCTCTRRSRRPRATKPPSPTPSSSSRTTPRSPRRPSSSR